MATAPLLVDAAVRHQVLLEQLKSGEVEKVAKYLRQVDKVIRDRLSGGNLTEWASARLEKMLGEVDSQLLAIYDQYAGQLESDLLDVAEYEAGFEARSLDQVLVGYQAATPTLPALRAAINTQPLQVAGADGGKLLKPFIKDWTANERDRVVNAVRLGYTQGQTNQQIIQAIRGTKAANYTDGVLGITQRNADAVVRTAVQHVANVARFETWEANDDIVEGYKWVSTLDSRTTQLCRSLDGRVFELGKGPQPPAHIRCRSTTVAELDPELDFLKKGATRSSVDGYVDADETYYEWLSKQPAAFQDQALGPARGKLFRDGGLSIERFSELQLDRKFKPLNLEQMKKLEPLAFEKAGIEPGRPIKSASAAKTATKESKAPTPQAKAVDFAQANPVRAPSKPADINRTVEIPATPSKAAAPSKPKLSREQVGVIEHYKGDGFYEANAVMRNPEKYSAAQVKSATAQTERLDGIIKQSKTTKDHVLYRGVRSGDLFDGAEGLVGKSLPNVTPQSTTVDKGVAENYAGLLGGFSGDRGKSVVLKVNAAKGSSALNVSDYTSINSAEREVLLRPGSRYKVKSVESVRDPAGNVSHKVIEVDYIEGD